MLRLASFIALTMVACTRYHLTLYQINDVEEFLNRIKLDWRTNDEEILRIMRLHAFYGKRFVIIFAAFVYPSACVTLIYHISPFILDKILPLNESRPTKFPIETDFLIDEEQHPILNNFLLYLSLIIAVSIMVGTESLMIMISTHIAGLYGVTSYYFQKAVLVESSASCRRIDCANNKSMSYIVSGVTVHQMARQFARDVNNRCNKSYVPSIMFGVLALSIHLFCLSETVLRTIDIRETILSVLLIISTLGYMFWMNLVVEFVVDRARSIPLTTYSTNWYETSVSTQKLLQLIIVNGHNRGSVFNFLSVYVPSVEGFAVLLKASVSYFAVLLSVR
ncbi:uncharacterized protein LOC105662053 [Megachile rotundata]|uniref:uncharacterized protein LOC105662053 n=1 Tax=Megachile rotundata TaxID=143995 RepID=UPI003FD4D057